MCPALYARVAPAAVIAIVSSSGLFSQACTKTSTSTGPSPAKCQVSVPTGLPAVAASGGSTLVNIAAQPECAWSAVAGASWIAELKPSTGQGNGQIEVVISPNGTAAGRESNVTINGSNVPIAQAGVACDYRLTGPTGPAAAGGATVTIAIAAA